MSKEITQRAIIVMQSRLAEIEQGLSSVETELERLSKISAELDDKALAMHRKAEEAEDEYEAKLWDRARLDEEAEEIHEVIEGLIKKVN